jgi:hypothetical protein
MTKSLPERTNTKFSIMRKINLEFLSRFLVALIFFVGSASYAFGQSTQTFPAGSLIIDMGVTPQTVGNGLKPYGLLYRLLQEKVPVAWSINPGKPKDGVDFTIGARQFRGGPFIVDAKYRTTTVNSIITAWQAQGVVTFTTTAPITVPIYISAFNQPKWTMDKQNGGIATGFFANAGIPATAYGGSDKNLWKLPSQLDCCDDIFVMPHADPIWLTHRNLVTWNLECKGAIWNGCHSPSALELMYDNIVTDGDPIDYNEQANFLSGKTGPAAGTGVWSTPNNTLTIWGSHSSGTPPYSYEFHDDPVMQFMGIIDAATQNGSEQIYIPRAAGWRPTTKVAVYDPDHPQRYGTATNPIVANFPNVYTDPIHRPAILAYGRGFGDSNRGFVMHEAGHNIAGTAPANVAAQRAFFNFSFLAAAEKAAIPIVNGLPSGIINSGQEYPLSVSFADGKVPAPPFSVVWSSSCGGTFLPNANSPNAIYIPPTAASTITCLITATITDACGRVTFDTEAVTVQCNFSVSPTVSNSCFNTPNGGAISYSVGGIGGTGTPSYAWTRTEGGSGSGTGTNIPGLSAGTYTVTVTGPNGCTASFTSTVSLSPEIIVSAIPTHVSCNGGTNGAINVSVSGGTPGYTYSWNDGPTTANRSGLVAGNYTLTVTDSKGCQVITPVTITQPAALVVMPNLTDVTCFDQNNGIINLDVSGGNPGVDPAPAYTFLWNDGNTSQNRTGLAPGTYSVKVTDSKNCSIEVTELTIAQPANALSLSSTPVNVLCFGQSTGSIDLTVTGGTEGYTYAWTKAGVPAYNANTEDISGLSVGTYNVAVTDSKGCTATREVTITQPPVLALSTQITHPTCPPEVGPPAFGFDGSINLTVEGGVGPYTYLWTAPVANPQGVVPSGQADLQDLATLQHGTYSVLVTDANNCTATVTVVLVAQNPKPVAPLIIKD